MKKIIILFMVGLLTQQIVQAQGTLTYLSNLGQSSTGSRAVGSDSWLAAEFSTGNNASGYVLNSVQLEMTNASGNPSGFTVMVYNNNNSAGFSPESNLDTLDGSLSPVDGGIFTYTPTSNLTLSSDTVYFIVLTAGTTVANGAYEWGAGNFYNLSGGWHVIVGSLGDGLQSSNGSSWNIISAEPQFAITATPVPEPSTLGLLGLGGLLFIRHRRKAKAA